MEEERLLQTTTWIGEVASTAVNTSSLSSSNYSLTETVFLILSLLTIIVGTIVGNVLVCIAVCLVRRLRRPCNYLLVSLAVSDLCVALLVMPMALVYEVMGSWPFGPRVCDAWVAFDVLSCTASILNLCMISVDRYWAITRPLDYGVKRTPGRMCFCVALVWLLAACISLPPLLVLGNDHGGDGLQCTVCQEFGYQIYATIGSFYIPLAVMAAVYYKIFQAAQRIVDEERKAQSHLVSQPQQRSLIVTDNGRQTHSTPCHPFITAADLKEGISNRTTCRQSIDSVPILRQSRNRSPDWRNTLIVDPVRRPSWPEDWTSSSQPRSRSSLDIPRYRRYSSTMTEINDTSVDASIINGSHAEMNLVTDHTTHDGERLPHKEAAPHFSKRPHVSRVRLRFALAKERKASTTLGIIMSAFTLCWLPFFVLALVRPFMSQPEFIPQWLSSLFLWLGYANSFLNPVIYATTNKDFRLPFREILCLRCKSLNSIMREEFYQSQYGEPRLQMTLNNLGPVHSSPCCNQRVRIPQPSTSDNDDKDHFFLSASRCQSQDSRRASYL